MYVCNNLKIGSDI